MGRLQCAVCSVQFAVCSLQFGSLLDDHSVEV